MKLMAHFHLELKFIRGAILAVRGITVGRERGVVGLPQAAESKKQ